MSRTVCGICWCPYDDDGRCGCTPQRTPCLRSAAEELRRQHAELDKVKQITLRDEALLRQALAALKKADKISGYPNNKTAIAAIKERLK